LAVSHDEKTKIATTANAAVERNESRGFLKRIAGVINSYSQLRASDFCDPTQKMAHPEVRNSNLEIPFRRSFGFGAAKPRSR
jgi:hypothetical protein